MNLWFNIRKGSNDVIESVVPHQGGRCTVAGLTCMPKVGKRNFDCTQAVIAIPIIQFV